MNQLPEWLESLRQRLPGEWVGDHVVRVFNAVDGVSFTKRRQTLDELYLINEPDINRARSAALAVTNCGTSMRAILAVAGAHSPWITKPYITGMAISWLENAARDCDALISLREHPNAWQLVEPGWCYHWGTPGKNDDHVEFALSVPDFETGIAEHGGGGQADNLISRRAPSDIRHHNGRPLKYVYRVDRLVLP